MRLYTAEEIVQFIDENFADIDKYETIAEKAGAYKGTLKAVKNQLMNMKK